MSGGLLVIAHEATRSGGNQVLAQLLRQVRSQVQVPVAVELLSGGPMSAELRSLATDQRGTMRPRAVLANSALSAHALHRFDAEVPCAVYVHEDDEALALLDDATCSALVERCSRVMCVSAAAAAAVADLGVPMGRIRIVPPVVGAVRPPDDTATAAARRQMGASPGDPLVVACGELAWHKGPDLFVDLALRLRDQPCRFAWVGRRPLGLRRVVEADAVSAGVDDRVVWTGEVPDALPFLRAADLVVSTSRRDAQPLVPVEAALLGTPTAGFAVGGLADLGSDGCAATVPYPDTVALADVVRSLINDPRRCAALASSGAQRAVERQSPDVVGRIFIDEVAQLLGCEA
ncbi:MAG: glycosyltransferase family 4 protein [Actinomycetes bacterium]